MSDNEYKKLLKEYLDVTGFKFQGGECYITIVEATEYPKGYMCYRWRGKNKPYSTDEYNEEHYRYIEIYQWVKDGKTVAPEDMIDIPMEEMLKFLYSKLRGVKTDAYYNFYYTDEKLTEEEIQRTARILSSHVVGFTPDDYMYPIFDFEEYAEYNHYEEKELNYTAHGLISDEEINMLPLMVLSKLMHIWNCDFSDINNDYYKHFKFYEGYEF